MKPSEKHSDSAFYGIAAKEIQAGNVDVGLMAKAVHQAKGNKKDAELLYLGWRVELLKEQAIDQAKAEAATREEMQRQEKVKAKLDPENIEKREDNFFWVAIILLIAFCIIWGVTN